MATGTRVSVSDEAFVKACLASKNIAEVATATGLAETTVQQRRVRLRNKGVALPEFTRGGGRKATPADLTAINALIASSLGKSAEDLSKEGAALVAAHAERTAEEVVSPPQAEGEVKAE